MKLSMNINVELTLTKKCNKCGEDKPLDAFHVQPRGKFGRNGRCKACRSGKRYGRSNDPKACHNCGITKPASEFSSYSAKKDGLSNTCKQCDSSSGKNARELNSVSNSILPIEVLRERTPLIKCYICKETKSSDEFGRKNERPSGLMNRCFPCDNTQSCEWRVENPDLARAYCASYRAKKEGLFLEDFTYEQIVERDGGEACGYCHTTEGPFDVDHIFPLNLNGWHTPDNLVLACAQHNRSKGATHPLIYVTREGFTPNETIVKALTRESELTRQRVSVQKLFITI